MDTIQNKAFKSVKWTVSNNFALSIITFFFSILTARILSPREYGIIAVANIFVSFGLVFSKMGLSGSIIQKKIISNEEISASFTTSIILGLVLYLLVLINIKRIETFYLLPNLGNILLLLSLSFILQSFIVTSTALLERNLDYKFLTRVELFTQIIGKGFITLIFALLGFGVWSIVIGILTSQILSTILLTLKNKNIFRITFKKEAYNSLYKYAIKYSSVQFLDFLYGNSNTLFMGKFFGPAITGIFDRASLLARLPISNIIVGVNRVMFPLYSRMQDKHNESTKIFFITIFFLGTSCSLIAGILAGTSEEIIRIALGPKWIEAINPLKYLAVFSCFEYLASIMFSPLDSNNKLNLRIYLKFIPFTLRLILYYMAFKYKMEFLSFLLFISVIEFIYFILYSHATILVFKLKKINLLILTFIQILNLVGSFSIIYYIKYLLTAFNLPTFISLGIVPFLFAGILYLNLNLSNKFGYLDFNINNYIKAFLIKHPNENSPVS